MVALLLALVVLAALWGVTSSFTVAAQRVDRDRATMAAIMQAKEALIAHAALNLDRPGSLPCPDTNNDGKAEAMGTHCANNADPNLRVGRLPYKTLDLPDIRDASGERLWYALSANFRRAAGTVVNSDTQGQIQLNGLAPSQRVVAVIIAPGAPLAGQTRDPSVPAQLDNIANYLEGENDYNNDGGVNNDVFQNATPSGAFNDIVVPITEEELFAVVENMVALRLRKDVRPEIDSQYRDFWGGYPFPAAFDPGSVPPPGYVGVVGATEGQLPVDPDQLTYAWTAAGSDTAVTLISGSLGPTNTCAASGTDWQCSIDVTSNGTVVEVKVNALDVGRAFAMWDTRTVPNNWVSLDNPTVPITAVAVGGALDASGNGTVTFRLTLDSGPTWTINLRPPEANPALTRGTATAAANVQFFFDNEWYRLVYYAASPGALPGGPLACTLNTAPGSPPCSAPIAATYQPLDKLLTCPGAPPALPPAGCIPRMRADGTTEDAGVMLVLAGRAMDVGGTVQTRPAATLDQYLEDPINLNNPVLTPREFEQKPRTTAFNDRVVIIAP